MARGGGRRSGFSGGHGSGSGSGGGSRRSRLRADAAAFLPWRNSDAGIGGGNSGDTDSISTPEGRCRYYSDVLETHLRDHGINGLLRPYLHPFYKEKLAGCPEAANLKNRTMSEEDYSNYLKSFKERLIGEGSGNPQAMGDLLSPSTNSYAAGGKPDEDDDDVNKPIYKTPEGKCRYYSKALELHLHDHGIHGLLKPFWLPVFERRLAGCPEAANLKNRTMSEQEYFIYQMSHRERLIREGLLDPEAP